MLISEFLLEFDVELREIGEMGRRTTLGIRVEVEGFELVRWNRL